LHKTVNISTVIEDKEIKDHIVKSFLDLIVLSMLKNNPTHGYGIMEYIYKKYDVLLSPGTLYPLLYSLEREGMITIEKEGRKKNYHLTIFGESQTEKILKLYSTNLTVLLKSL